MYLETVDKFAELAAARTNFLKSHPAGFFISSMMAGIYVGLGIILIFCLGNDIDPSLRRLVMGTSFGIALTLVMFAGSDLFTGLTMFMTHGVLQKRASLGDLGRVWALSWLGNLAGSVLVAALFSAAGGGGLLFGKSTFLFDVATAKMTAPPLALFARAILCNWLVCLALWSASRVTSDAAKCILIFWCLFAFIGSGYEHSVANMTLLSLAPSILLLMTCFTRVAIVLAFVRSALQLQGSPGNQIIIGLSLFITYFVMAPVWEKINTNALVPYQEKKISSQEALDRASGYMRAFMLKQTRPKDVELFVSMAKLPPTRVEDLPLRVVTPSFIISELRTAFQMGFLILVPFILIDVVVSTVLMSMGMMMLPPATIAMPIKILLFVLVDGWALIVRSLIMSFGS